MGTDNDYYRLVSTCLNKFVEMAEIPAFPKQMNKDTSVV